MDADGHAWLGDAQLGRWTGTTWDADVRLTLLELRFLADRGIPHPCRDLPILPAPRTDLHTHFAGCVRGPDLVRIGAAHGMSVPADLARRAGIDASGELRRSAGGAAELSLADTTDAVRARYASALALPVDVQSTHHDMGRVYDLRRPGRRHPPLRPLR